MDQLIRQAVKTMVTDHKCVLCNVIFMTPTVKESHCASKRHLAKLEAYRVEFKENLSSLQNVEVPKVNVNPWMSSANLLEKQKNTASSLQSQRTEDQWIYCYICKKNISKAEKSVHLTSFPHQELLETKLILVKKGFAEDFWGHYKEGILCKLCDVKLPGSPQFKAHFKSQHHRNQLEGWLNGLSAMKPDFRAKAKWFYCHICPQDLDGTAEAAKHYEAFAHEKRASMFCETCEKHFYLEAELKRHKESVHVPIKKTTPLPRPTVTFSVPKPAIQSFSNNSTVMQPPPPFPAKVNVENSLGPVSSAAQSTQESNANGENKDLKDQVFNQLQKLVQKLYYSKTVPYEYGLDYLKKVNKEVDEFSTKTPMSNGAEVAGSLISDKEKIADSSKSSETAQEIPGDSASVVIQPVIGPKVLTENIPTPPNVESNSRKWFPDILNVSGAEKPTEPGSNDIKTLPEPNNLDKTTKKAETISDLLADIIEQKHKVEAEHRNEPMIEKDVLSEIELLLRKIEQGDVSLAETLECLERYNEQLDKEDFTTKENKNIYHQAQNGAIPKRPKETTVKCESNIPNFQENELKHKTLDTLDDLAQANGNLAPEMNAENVFLMDSKEEVLESTDLSDTLDDLAQAHLDLAPEMNLNNVFLVDSNVLDSVDISPSVDDIAEEENEKKSEAANNEDPPVIRVQENNVKYTREELTCLRPLPLTKLDPLVKSQIEKFKICREYSGASISDYPKSIYSYYSGENFNLFVEFLDVYLNC